MDVEKIARGLLKAQREAVLAMSSQWEVNPITNEPTLFLPWQVIEQRVPRKIGTEEVRLSETGLAVRAYLEKNSD